MKPKIKVVEVKVQPMDTGDLRKAKNGKKKARMYFFPKGENVLENLVARTFRPKVLYRTVFDEVFEKASVGKPERITWDQYAGCAMCPCSPGFVLDGIFNVSIYVTYEGDQVIEEAKPAFEELKQSLIEESLVEPAVEEPVVEPIKAEEPVVEPIKAEELVVEEIKAEEPVVEEMPETPEPAVEEMPETPEPAGEFKIFEESTVRDNKGRFVKKVKINEEVPTV